MTDTIFSDALGGRAYYMGRIEVEFPASSAFADLGLRPSAFVDVGSVWKLTKQPDLLDIPGELHRRDGSERHTAGHDPLPRRVPDLPRRRRQYRQLRL